MALDTLMLSPELRKGVCVFTPDWPISSLPNGFDSNPDIYPPPYDDLLLICDTLFFERPLGKTRKETILNENVISLTGNKDHPNACLCYMLYCLTIGKPLNLAYYIAKRMESVTKSDIMALPYGMFMRYSAFGRHLKEIHATWDHLEKKWTRLQNYTNISQEFLLSSWRQRHRLHVLENQLLSVSLLICLGKHDCVEKIPSDRHLGKVVFGKPFARNTGLVYNKEEGTVTFEKDDEKITFKMPHKMEASNRIDFKDINTDSIPPFVLESNDDLGKTYYSNSLTLGPEYREDESISKEIRHLMKLEREAKRHKGEVT
nr:pentatricopeptide repeat-containing protein [Tanacetum cinerariifolium]